MPQLLVSIRRQDHVKQLLRLLQGLDYVEKVEPIKEKQSRSLPLLYDSSLLAYSVEDIRAVADYFPKDKKWVYRDLLDYFPPDLKIKVQIIDNQLFIMPSATPLHQRLSRKLSFLLDQHIVENQSGELFCAPLDVKLDENTVLQPDILFVSEENKHLIGQKCIEGTPDLVVEIDSPSNTSKEIRLKKKKYELFGVKEYWEVKPKEKQISVDSLENGQFQAFSEGKEEEIITSKVLKGLKINLKEVFDQK
jgi:Uma2 family endonuclease